MTVPGSPPSDLDLMLYADGELEDARRVQVEAWLAADGAARAKLAALGIVSRVVREHALDTAERAGDLTDSIMQRIDLVDDGGLTRGQRALPPVANDNARRLFFVAAAVVAAAAAAMLWLRPAPDPAALIPSGSVILGQAPAPGHALDVDLEHGVEVSSVDFGSTTGAVFYIPNGTSPSDTTTLVWLADDADGEDE